MSTLPCAECGRPFERREVGAVRAVVTIEHDLTIRPPFEVYELYCSSCRLGAGDESLETFDDLLADVPVWHIRKRQA